MDLKNLPAGRSFRVTTGPNNFTKKFNRATRFGALKNLRDNKDSIIKALKPMERVIRLGKFGRLAKLQTMSKIKKLEGYKLTKQDKGDIKKVFAQLSGKKSAASQPSSPPPVVRAAALAPEKEAVLSRRRLTDRFKGGRLRATNRDPNNELECNGLRIQGGKRGETRVVRSQMESLPRFQPGPVPSGSLMRGGIRSGEVSRAAMNYQRMARLGSGEAATKLQKSTYGKLQSVGDGLSGGKSLAGRR